MAHRARYGLGGTFQRGGVWWIRYSYRGMKRRESTGSPREKDARDLLKRRLAEMGKGRLLGPDAERLTVAELAAALFAAYETAGARSVASAHSAWKKHLQPFFGERRAIDVTAELVRAYIQQRRAEAAGKEPETPGESSQVSAKGHAPASINYSLRLLRRMFALAVKEERFGHVPPIPTLSVQNARKGFFEHADFTRVVALLPRDLADAARFAYLTGWRKAEVMGLEWREVNLPDRTVRLAPERSKTKAGRAIGLAGDLLAILERRRALRRLDCPLVFHRDGHPLGDFRKTWQTACRNAGVAGRLFHDLRRTAVRNLVRAGVAEHTAMNITGHKTRAVFDRYDIIDRRDTEDALARVQAHLVAHAEAQPAVAVLAEAR